MSREVKAALITAFATIVAAIIVVLFQVGVIPSPFNRPALTPTPPPPVSQTSLASPTPTSAFTPTPTPSIPRLHPSYTGTLTLVNNGQQYTLTISNLTEKPDGSFTGSSGLCVAFLGSIESDGSINFIDKPSNPTPPFCSLRLVYYPFGTFSGKLYPDGSIMGDWQGTSSTGSPTSGIWKLS